MSKREMLKTTIKSAKMLLVFYGNFFKMMREEQPGNQIMFSDEEFQGAIELFFTVLLSKMVEKQDKEKMPLKKRNGRILCH